VGGGDFDLVKSDLNSESLAFDFRFYPGQLGTDRSASLTFAVGRGNMIDPLFELNREDEATIAIVGGQGKEDDRDYLTRTGANYGANNHIEMFVSSHAETTAGRQATGDKRLAEREARELFEFQLKQTPNCVYGKHFFLGDLGKAVNPFTDVASTVKINSVTLSLSEDGKQEIYGEASTP
jgi:hypothetical protein